MYGSALEKPTALEGPGLVGSILSLSEKFSPFSKDFSFSNSATASKSG
jgi:hypothetical protein